MKKLLSILTALVLSYPALADEGMWLLPYLQKMNERTMREMGCELTAEDIYSAQGSSLKDAIVVFGDGCTGEIVSPNGLLFTNHHCGYSSIQELSSVDHDYLKYGFWANNMQEEIPAPGLKVRFVREILDVTATLLGNIPSIASGAERSKLVDQNVEQLVAQLMEQYPDMEIWVRPFFGGNQYFAFINEVYRDVRLVGTPPSSIGKFGGETDNWMWPRHTGDFSIFRIYADKENRPAEYSPENVPYKAERHLAISTRGYEQGDFAFIMGFPGSTERYMTSYEIDYMLEVDNPQRIYIRGERQAILKEDMLASDRVRIQYASKYARSSNYWKNSIGMSRGIMRLNVKGKKQEQEAAFQAWAEANTLPEERYMEALEMIRSSVEGAASAKSQLQYLREAFLSAVEIISPALALSRIEETESAERMAYLKEALGEWYKDYNAPTDRKVAKRMLTIARENMKVLPSIYTEVIDKRFKGSIDAYVDYLYDRSLFTSVEGVNELLENYSKQQKRLKKDPAVELARSVMELYNSLIPEAERYEALYEDGHRLYIAGLMLQNPEKGWASDANFTLRLTYGQVLPYRPADGVRYNYYTTLKGVIEKEDLENPSEFFVPERLKELYATSDFGRWADKNGEMPVAFLANCDITGGNSGSPIMNSRGELIGLAFDGNWEAMSGDVAFEPELQRTISVDIRYVLFIIEKFAGASWLLEELTINE
uniref:S46 family peptidase n=1 Tax=Alistipes sp. TaxID=1872444 RepID=UPI004055E648